MDLWFFDLAQAAPLQFTAKGSGSIAPNEHGDFTGVASYDQGEWSVIFKRPLRAAVGHFVLARRVHADRVLGLGRVLARARQQAGPARLWYSLYVEPENVPSASGPMVRTALLILALELVVIGGCRRRPSAAQDAGRGGGATEAGHDAA